MTIEEIFNQLGNHMVEGLMIHSQLAEYYNFLGLKGYYRCHQYHYFEENNNYKCLCRYYMKHYNKLINEGRVADPGVIPEAWFKYTRQDVSSANRKSSIQAGMERWTAWETETKKLYERMVNELMTLGEVAAATKVKEFLCDVDKELADACQKNLELKSVDYDIVYIMDKQKEMHDKYKKKLKEIELC